MTDWSQAHHGIDPAGVPFLRGWLRLVHGLATPLVALRVPPDAVTAAGLGFSLAVPVLAATDHTGAAVAAVGVSVLLDGLDGAVALRTGRVSSYGRTLDSTCDRVSELAWWGALVAVGAASPAQATALAGLTLALEGWRAVTGRHGALTVWERPSRTILVVVGLLGAGIGPAGVTGWVGLALAGVGAAQLVRAVAQGR